MTRSTSNPITMDEMIIPAFAKGFLLGEELFLYARIERTKPITGSIKARINPTNAKVSHG
jgi:hypothetical protein